MLLTNVTPINLIIFKKRKMALRRQTNDMYYTSGHVEAQNTTLIIAA